MTLRVVVFVPGRPGITHRLGEGRRHTIGRDPDADLTIEDPRVSRDHATLGFEDGEWCLRDCLSKNGTRIDGRPIAAAKLRGPRWISFGGIPAYVEIANDARASRSSIAPAVPASAPATDDPDALIDDALRAFARAADCARAGLWRHVERGGVERIAWTGPIDPAPSMHTIAEALATGRPVFCSDTDGASALARRDSIAAGGIRAIVVLPAGPEAVYADSLTPGKLFTEDDADALQGLADQLALTLAAARMRDQLERMTTDRRSAAL